MNPSTDPTMSDPTNDPAIDATTSPTKKKKRGFKAFWRIMMGDEGAAVAFFSIATIVLSIFSVYYMARAFESSSAAAKASQDSAAQARIANQLKLVEGCLDGRSLAEFLEVG